MRRFLLAVALAACVPPAHTSSPGEPQKGPHFRTNSPEAQRLFEAGLAALYAEDRDTASAQLAAALRSDPACGMCAWGAALASSPQARGTAAADARRLATTPVERALADALVAPSYVAAMREVARAYPDDDVVQLALADALIGANSTADAGAVIEPVLARTPDNAGAIHLAARVPSIWYARMLEGRRAATKQLAASARPSDGLAFMRALAIARFGEWDEAASLPDSSAPGTAVAIHFARGLAAVAQGRLGDAEREVPTLREAHPDAMAETAASQLEGTIAWVRGDRETAIASLERAMGAEKSAPAGEMQPFPLPARQRLAAMFIELGRPHDAELLYREDLDAQPENGWALFGLATALDQQHSPDAPKMWDRFRAAWKRADIQLAQSVIMPHLASAGSTEAPAVKRQPRAQVRPVTDTYHGVTVKDSYRWLEVDDAATKAWSAGQSKYTRDVLDHLPDAEKLRGELRAILTAPVTKYGELKSAGGKVFARRKQAGHEQPELVVMDDAEKPETARLVYDPAAAGGAQQAIDWFVPAPDGKKLAVSISFGGSEAGTLHVIGLDGRDLEPPIPNVQHGTAGGSVAWTPDSRALYYTRYPAAGEKPENERDAWMNVWFHKLGTPATADQYEMGKDLPKIAEITLASDPAGRVIASVQNGDGGTFRHYLRDGIGWRRLDDWNDGIVYVTFGAGEDLWLVSQAGAPHGKVMRLAGSATSAADAKVVIPEVKDAIYTDFEHEAGPLVTRDHVYVSYQVGGPMELRAFGLDGKPVKGPELPPVSAHGTMTAWRGGVVVAATTFTSPTAYYWFDAKAGKTSELAGLSPKSPVDLSGMEVKRELATSKDGTKIPLTILWPKDAKKDGSTRCLVTGYGGFGISQKPRFMETLAPLMKRGMCIVDVNTRGGGEFGEAWHRAGSLVKKQNVFDDFTAALRFLIDRRYTSKSKLAIFGGSNGGLLMGAMIASQHPDLVRVVASAVGIYDMLRVELSPNGAYNVTEYGTVADKAQFQALYAYSPYHHVTQGQKYPAILLATGANDPRVSPWQSRKFAAALQAARAGNEPVLLRTSDKAGHGMGSSTSENISLWADLDAFVLAQLQ